MKFWILIAFFGFSTLSGFAQGTPPLTVREVDNSPRKQGINTLVFPNGSVTVSGSTATITSGVSGLSSTETLVTSSLNFRVPGNGSSSTANLQVGREDIGIISSTSGGTLSVTAAAEIMRWSGVDGSTRLHAAYPLWWGSSGFTSPDIGLERSAANVLKVSNGSSGFGMLYSSSVRLNSITKTTLDGLSSPAAGTLYYCSDCKASQPCGTGTTGALAIRRESDWACY